MKETIPLEVTPRELELILDAVNSASVALHDKITDKKGKIDEGSYFFKTWQELHTLWCKGYDLEQNHESVAVWK